jgi:Protein of unknown function (DUF3467)
MRESLRVTLVGVSGEDFINSGGEVTGPGSGPSGPGPQPDGGTFSQQITHSPVSARVPERVARGVMCTGVIVLTGPNEFILDFVQVLARPAQLVARVVLPPPVAASFTAALRDNLDKYAQSFGPPPPLPRPPQRRPNIQEVYENLKLPDDLLSGAYANAAIVGHSPAEFFFDFITGFYPTAAVSARVFLAASQAPRVLEAVSNAVRQFEERPRPSPRSDPPGET